MLLVEYGETILEEVCHEASPPFEAFPAHRLTIRFVAGDKDSNICLSACRECFKGGDASRHTSPSILSPYSTNAMPQVAGFKPLT
jgi:hypothetical protein